MTFLRLHKRERAMVWQNPPKRKDSQRFYGRGRRKTVKIHSYREYASQKRCFSRRKGRSFRKNRNLPSGCSSQKSVLPLFRQPEARRARLFCMHRSDWMACVQPWLLMCPCCVRSGAYKNVRQCFFRSRVPAPAQKGAGTGCCRPFQRA